MSNFEYIYKADNLIHVLQVKASQNSKLGKATLMQTYHFDVNQLVNFQDDKRNCMGCPFSYSTGGALSGKCYTHKGLQRMGLNSMLKRLAKMDIEEFDILEFSYFIHKAKKAKLELIRLGSYGEPVSLALPVRDAIFNLVVEGTKVTGYTHAWRTVNDTRFMASTHSANELQEAILKGYRAFTVTTNGETIDKSLAALCPASKEAGRKSTCATCGLCNGTLAKTKKSIYIPQH